MEFEKYLHDEYKADSEDDIEYLMLGEQSCFVVTYIFLLKQCNKEWMPIFSVTWNLNLEKNKILNQVLDKKFGITEINIHTDEKDFLMIAGQALKNHRKIVVEMDPFYCPWNLFYMENHGIHFCIITDINWEESKIICVDKFISDELYEWDFQLFEAAIRKMYIYKVEERYQHFTGVDLCKYLLQNFSEGVEDIISGFSDLKGYISEPMEFHMLFEGKYGETCKIIIFFKQMEMLRLGIYRMLIWQDRKEGSGNKYLQRFAALFLIIYEQFQSINVLLFKMFLIKKINPDIIKKIMCKLDEICKLEIQIYQEIEECIRK